MDVYTRIFDIAHMDRDVLAQLAAEVPGGKPGVAFLKIDEGTDDPDDKAAVRVPEAERLGYVTCGYHYMTGMHPGGDQWAYFKGLYVPLLQAAGADPTRRIILVDHERAAKVRATPAHTLAFCDAATADGFRVLVYFGQSQGMTDWPAGHPIGRYPGMMAAYGPDPRTEHVPGAWAQGDPHVTVPVRQYSNGNGTGGAGPADRVTFPRSPCDRSCYFGTEAQALAFFGGT